MFHLLVLSKTLKWLHDNEYETKQYMNYISKERAFSLLYEYNYITILQSKGNYKIYYKLKSKQGIQKVT